VFSLVRYMADLMVDAEKSRCDMVVGAVEWVRSGAVRLGLERALRGFVEHLGNICVDMWRNRAVVCYWLPYLLERAEEDRKETVAVALLAVPIMALLGRLPTLVADPVLVGEGGRELVIYTADTVSWGESWTVSVLLPLLIPMARGDLSPTVHTLLREAVREAPALLKYSPATEDEVELARTLMELSSPRFMDLEIAYSKFMSELEKLVKKHYKLFKKFLLKNGHTIKETTRQALSLSLYAELWPRKIKLHLKDRTVRYARQLLKEVAQTLKERGLTNIAEKLHEIAEKS